MKRISEELEKRINTHIELEENSSRLYRAMGEWFEYNGNTFCFKVYIDVIQEILTEENLKKVYELIYKYKNKRLPIKTVLLDQSIITGIGNIYDDEILFKSRIK